MNLFAYGTLMWPEVLESVVGRRLEGAPATVAGFRRYCVEGQSYPAAVAAEGERMEGVVYRDLTEREFRGLDAFEGEEYDRIEVMAGGAAVQIYVLSPAWTHILSPEPWSPERMSPGQLAEFCAEYKGWVTAEAFACRKRH
jgi:gamma-glutamylcyclotransferase (GGCT)/AIG2-like uncharacterized protein YtfP